MDYRVMKNNVVLDCCVVVTGTANLARQPLDDRMEGWGAVQSNS
jgi:hypothetical protein